MTDQVPTTRTTTQLIMRSTAFAAGVDDVRNGRAPNYDNYKDEWSYERGRLWASLAPSSMPLAEPEGCCAGGVCKKPRNHSRPGVSHRVKKKPALARRRFQLVFFPSPNRKNE